MKRLLVIAMMIAVAPAFAQVAQTTPEAIAAAWEFLPTYEFGQDRLPLTSLDYAIRDAQGDDAELADFEQKFVAVLENPAATLESKRWTLRHLAAIGSAASVPAIAASLEIEGLEDYAVRALEASTATEAGAALRAAMANTDEKQPYIRALGQRGEESREVLGTLLGDSLAYGDTATAAMAANALADVGGTACDDLIAIYREGEAAAKDSVVDACLTCAEAWAMGEGMPRALELYTALIAADQPLRIRMAAFDGLVRNNPEAALQFVIETADSEDPLHLNAALHLSNKFPTVIFPAAIQHFDQMPTHVKERVLLNAGKAGYVDMGPIAAAQLANEDEAIRLAAITSLGTTGKASDVPALLEIGANGSGEARRLARTALSTLPGGTDTNTALLEAAEAGGKLGEEALRALEQRRAEALADTLMAKFVMAGEVELRDVAIETVATVGSVAHLTDLLSLLQDDAVNEATKRRVLVTAGRIVERAQETAAPELLAALNSAEDEVEQVQIISLLANAQSEEVLANLGHIARDSSPAIEAAAVATLAQWKTPAPRELLLAYAQRSEDEQARATALEAFVAMTTQANLAPGETVSQLKEALAAAKSAPEKKQVLSGLSNVTSLEALAAIQEQAQDESVRAEAETAAVKVAAALGGAYPEKAKAALSPYISRPEGDPLRTQAAQALDRMNKAQGFITAWELAGPYMLENEDAGHLFTQTLEPETNPTAVPWRILPMGSVARPAGYVEPAAGLVDLFSAIGGFERAAYIRSQVFAPAAQDAVLEVSSDDGVKIWLNGELVHQKMMLRAVDMAQDKISVKLNEGWNDIVLGVYNLGSDWGASVKVTTPEGQPIEGLVARVPEAVENQAASQS